jgi:hypothetical protein
MVINECVGVGGLRIGSGNQCVQTESLPMSMCPPQIAQNLTWDQTRYAAAGSRRLDDEGRAICAELRAISLYSVMCEVKVTVRFIYLRFN